MMAEKMSKKERIEILYTNADCLTNKMTELDERVKISWPGVIAINEVKYKNMEGKTLRESEFSLIPNKYELFGNNIEKKAGRGQLLFVDKKYKPDEITLTTKAEEVLVVNLTDKENEKITVALLYRSPSSTNANNTKMNKVISEIVKLKSKSIVIVGDFNHKEIDWDTLEGQGDEQDNFLDCIVENNLWQHVHENTRFRGTNKPSKLDLVFSNEEYTVEDMVLESGLGKSDHAVIRFFIQGEAGPTYVEKKGKTGKLT